ncbi:MAG: hypothetical protein AAGI15_02485 [Pseudomonadota bacterium]
MAEHDDMDFDFERSRSFPLSDAERAFEDDYFSSGASAYDDDADLFDLLGDEAANDDERPEASFVARASQDAANDGDLSLPFDDDFDDEPLWEDTPPDAFFRACQRQLEKGPQGDVHDDSPRTPAQAVLRAGGRDRGPSYLL